MVLLSLIIGDTIHFESPNKLNTKANNNDETEYDIGLMPNDENEISINQLSINQNEIIINKSQPLEPLQSSHQIFPNVEDVPDWSVITVLDNQIQPQQMLTYCAACFQIRTVNNSFVNGHGRVCGVWKRVPTKEEKKAHRSRRDSKYYQERKALRQL
jgi:hypothetical protein